MAVHGQFPYNQLDVSLHVDGGQTNTGSRDQSPVETADVAHAVSEDGRNATSSWRRLSLSSTSVSYTHLDVYKRQVIHRYYEE